jgi:hypothetical protein
MISEACLKRALGRVALLRFFPQNNPEALAAVAELLSEMCADGAALARAVDYDIVEPNGARHWHDGVFYAHPRKPWEGDGGAPDGAGDADPHPDPDQRATVTPRAAAGISRDERERITDYAVA